MESYFTRRKSPEIVDYEQDYWGEIVDPDGNVRNRLDERQQHLEDLAEELSFIDKLQPGKILDIGCGLGFLLSGISEKWEKHGVEVSRFATGHANQWGNVFCGELREANFPDEHFDVIVLYHVIEHIEEPSDLLIEIKRILKQGGNLVLGTPDFDSGCARHFGENYRLLHDKTHVSLFTNESMHRFLRYHDLVIDRVGCPFFNTRHFTKGNLLRLFDTDKISPPFYGNFMTFYCHKP